MTSTDDTKLTIATPDAKCYALVVSAGEPSKPILSINIDGTLWIDPEHTDETARRLLDFYCQIRETRFNMIVNLVHDLTRSMVSDMRQQQTLRARNAELLLKDMGL